MVFFRLSSTELGLLLFAVLLGATGLGIFVAHHFRHLSDDLKEPFGILQAALLGLVGLLLAFGLSLAVSRYEDRRGNVVTVANAIGTGSRVAYAVALDSASSGISAAATAR